MGIQIWGGYQSRGIKPDEWIALFTLCLAPLGAHIFVGVPEPVYLSSTRPRWAEGLCHYNPTSILWRYFAIADRRLRARDWTAVDMAASNAHFWTADGWDGSERMIEETRFILTKPPSAHRVTLWSKTSVKTFVVTLQGFQALYSLVGAVTRDTMWVYTIAMDSVFFPVSLFGLLRLFAAFWLTEDYIYSPEMAQLQRQWPVATATSNEPKTGTALEAGTSSAVNTEVQATEQPLPVPNPERFRGQSSWRGIVFRLIYIGLLLGLLALAVLFMVPMGPNDSDYSYTGFTLEMFSIYFLLTTIVIFLFYILRGKSRTTIIPCISSRWYLVYTIITFLFMFALVVIAALETRQTPCGKYSTFWYSDGALCHGVSVSSNGTNPFGLAMPASATQPRAWIQGWEGFCIGDPVSLRGGEATPQTRDGLRVLTTR